MAQTNIDSLPEEILLNIFGYLSPKLIKTCCEVSTRWNQIIKDSCMFRDKFRLRLRRWEALEDYKKNQFSNNFDSVIMILKNEYGCMIDGFKDVVNSCYLTSLELMLFNMELSELVDLLNYLPKLEVFGLKNVTLEGYPRALIKKAKVKKLKKLDLSGQSFILDNFLKEFCLEFSGHSHYTDMKQWIKLLEEQKGLQNLTIGPSATWLFFQFTEIFNFKFQLTRFNAQGNKVGNVDAFCKFLEIHSGTLEKLILRCMPPEYSFEIYEFIWNKLPALKHTDICVREFYRFDWMLHAHPELLPNYQEKLPSMMLHFGMIIIIIGVVDWLRNRGKSP